MTGVGATFALEPAGTDATFAARGMLSFATAAQALAAITRALDGGKLATLDLARVSHGDSAGIACLLAARAAASAQGRALAFTHIPEGMRTLARVCGAEGLLD